MASPYCPFVEMLDKGNVSIRIESVLKVNLWHSASFEANLFSIKYMVKKHKKNINCLWNIEVIVKKTVFETLQKHETAYFGSRNLYSKPCKKHEQTSFGSRKLYSKPYKKTRNSSFWFLTLLVVTYNQR